VNSLTISRVTYHVVIDMAHKIDIAKFQDLSIVSNKHCFLPLLYFFLFCAPRFRFDVKMNATLPISKKRKVNVAK